MQPLEVLIFDNQSKVIRKSPILQTDTLQMESVQMDLLTTQEVENLTPNINDKVQT